MSTELAHQEMRRFLENSDPKVLSISGRWGVGKTFGWNKALSEAIAAQSYQLTRYAYVSAFGVRDIESLKTTIVQSTVRLGSGTLEPTIESFTNNISTIDGLTNLAERGGRKSLSVISKLSSLIPYGDKAAELLIPGAALLIKNQFVCIDDLERAGEGLKVKDILGFATMLSEEKNCKVILLLNEEGLGDQTEDFQTHLEKVVDQSIKYIPTPQESSSAVLDLSNPFDAELSKHTEKLGITNIRVIVRLRRSLSYVEPILTPLHFDVTKDFVSSIALIGWSIFEPKLAPPIEYIKDRNLVLSRLEKEKPTGEEARWNALLDSYRFAYFSSLDNAILDGLSNGGFNIALVKQEAELVNEALKLDEVRKAIRKPWEILGGSFETNEAEFQEALIESATKYSADMSAPEINDVVSTLKDLGETKVAGDLLQAYMDTHKSKPRQFFDLNQYAYRREFDDDLKAAFDEKLQGLPLDRNPKELLLDIERRSGWNPEDIDFLASLSDEDYYQLLKGARDDELRAIVSACLRFNNIGGADAAQLTVGRKAVAALTKIGTEGKLNAMRVRPYIPKPSG